MNSRLLGAASAVVLAICGGVIWFLNSQPSAQVEPIAVVEKPTPAPEPAPKTINVVRPRMQETLPSSDPVDAMDSPKTPAPPLAEWEVKIDNVLRANADEAQTAKMLINMLPTLPREGQAEAAQHIANLVVDKDYGQVLPLVTNAGLPREVLDVFVTDLMNREDNVKLPALLDIAKIPNHPSREEAATDLQIFLDEDHGTDWARWDIALKAYLKRQAAENAAAENAVPGVK